MIKMTITKINKFINARQPNKKMTLANEIKQEDKQIYNNIMQQTIITINGKTYTFNKQKNKYI